MTEPPLIFISYSHKDETWKDKLAIQLGVLAKEDRLDPWDDRRIAAGDDWFAQIERAIGAAQVAIFLISADFLNSDFIRHKEVPPLLARRQSKGLRVVPILVRPCPWKKVEWLAKIQMRPADGREIAAGTDYQIDKDSASIAEEIDGFLVVAAPAGTFDAALSPSSKFDLSALPPTGPHFFGREVSLRNWTKHGRRRPPTSLASSRGEAPGNRHW